MAFTRFSSIRSKLFVLFLAGAVFPLALVSLLAYFTSLRAVEQMVGNRTAGLAQRVGEDLSRKLRIRLDDRILVENRPAQDFLAAADAVAAGKKISGAEVSRLHRDLRLYLARLFEEYGGYYEEVIYADASGHPACRFHRSEGAADLARAASAPQSVSGETELPRGGERYQEPAGGPGTGRRGTAGSGTLPFPTFPSLGGFTEQDRAAAREGLNLAPGEVRITTDRVSPGNTRILRVVMPVFSVVDVRLQKETMVADLRMDYLFPASLAGERFGSHGELAVVNAESGEILFHTRAELVGRNMRLVDPALLRAFRTVAQRGGESPWVKAPGQPGTRLASAFGLRSVPWKVIAASVPLEFEAEARRAGYRNLLVASLVVLLAGSVLLVFGKRISDSIKEVTRGARRIAEGNLDHSIRVTTHDEIQTLGETFNAMTASLRESIAMRDQAARELELLNRTLEDRVQERTRKLETLNEALNQANRELTELDRLKSHFLSTVSHEFKTPLTSIKAFAEILLDEADSRNASEEMKRFLGIINSESDRLSRLIRNLLNMSRLESGRMLWRMSVFPVKEVVDAALDGLLPVFRSREVELVRNTDCPGARFHADRDRIQEVVTNLLENAVKFSPRGGKVWIACTEEADANGGRRLRISIRDEGPGIPPDHLEKIFDRFSQVDASDTRSKGGTGLGLAISREIVEHHGGRIWAESTLGGGTTFHFWLRLVGDGERVPTADGPGGKPALRETEREHHG